MKRYGKVSRFFPEKILDRSRRFFGPGGLGLEIREQNPGSITFEGGGGFVTITVRRSSNLKRTDVELISREWDYPAAEYLRKI